MATIGGLQTSEDAFLGGSVIVHQPIKGHRAGIDAVLLAASLALEPSERVNVLDVGCGSGIVGFCAACRLTGAQVVGLDKEPELVALARQNAALNEMSGRTHFIVGDVCEPLTTLRAKGIFENGFDHVLANPPFHTSDSAPSSPFELRRAATSMAPGMLEEWLRFLATVTKPGGTATLVHRADALDGLLSGMRKRFGGIVVHPLFPRADVSARRVIVRGTKGSRAPLEIMRGLVLHDEVGQFLPTAAAILRNGAPLLLKGNC